MAPLSVQGVPAHSPECASQLLSCGHSRTQLLTLHPSPHTTPHRQGAGNARGSRSIPGQQEGCWGLQKDAQWEGCSAEQRPGGASRCRPPALINYSRVAPNRFHLKSSEAGGRRKAVPDKGGRFDTH